MAAISRWCPVFGGKNTLQERFGTKDSVRCSGGGRFSEVANVYYKYGIFNL